MTRLLSTSEAAKILGVTRQTVRRWIIEGNLKAIRIGRNIRIHQSCIDDILINGLPLKETEKETQEETES